MSDLLRNVMLAVPVGLLFGASAHLSGVSSPMMIRSQFLFEHEIMMKMFLGGLAGSSLSLAILSWRKPLEFEKVRESRGFGDKGAVTAVLGGIIQGVGMALAGSCPGMAFAQIGAGVRTAPLTYAGGLTGASLYAYLHPWLKEHHVFDFAQTLDGRFESMHLERMFTNGRFIPLALGFAILTLSAALGMEKLVPWRNEVALLQNVDQAYSINPTLAGLIIGSLQIPAFFLLNSLLGASSGYSVTSAQVLRFFPDEFCTQFSYAKSFVTSKATWQVGFGLGIIGGASIASGYATQVLASMQAGEPLTSSANAVHVPSLHAFLGGLLIVFGARFVGGCASGHGLSGIPSFHVVSWFTIPAMFAGAIATAHLMSSFVMPQAEFTLRGQ